MFDQIEFLNPDFLYLLILIPFILVLELLRNKMQNPGILWSSSYLIEKKLNWKIILKYSLLVTKSIALSAIIISTLCYVTTCVSCIRGADYPHAPMWFAYALANLGLLWYELEKVGRTVH